ncbi:MAG TPA: hypothetical protein VMW53_07420 [archaeon]|nr:hypothetical protein [archaeon]
MKKTLGYILAIEVIVMCFIYAPSYSPQHSEPLPNPVVITAIQEEKLDECPYPHLAYSGGAYFPGYPGRIECCVWEFCLHEIAHKIDYEENDRFSASKEWEEIVEYYRDNILELTGDPTNINDYIDNFWNLKGNRQGEWGGYAEVYAEILRYSHGSREYMPEFFREFYNWDRIEEIMQIEKEKITW